jgi:hypothetical protein
MGGSFLSCAAAGSMAPNNMIIAIERNTFFIGGFSFLNPDSNLEKMFDV